MKLKDDHGKMRLENDYPDMTSTASATETTGMMPARPRTPEDYVAYQDLAGMEIPKLKNKK